MELDWSTFLLEIGNFLVLVWILKRFLYHPVLDVIARRREAVDKTLADADQRVEQAKALGDDYQRQLDDWARTREKAHEELAQELAAERERRLQQLEQAVAAEKEKAQALASRTAQATQRKLETAAIEQGTRFAARLLERLAGETLDARIVALFVEDLLALDTSRRQALLDAATQPGLKVQLVSARPLDEASLQAVRGALEQLAGRELPVDMQQDPQLLSGLSVLVGPLRLDANLRDELRFFRAGEPDAD